MGIGEKMHFSQSITLFKDFFLLKTITFQKFINRQIKILAQTIKLRVLMIN
jgi:hypothetical protein